MYNYCKNERQRYTVSVSTKQQKIEMFIDSLRREHDNRQPLHTTAANSSPEDGVDVRGLGPP